MRKKIAALLAASIVLGALAGCSGSQGGAQATTAAETTAASTTSAGESKSAENSDSKEKVVLNWLHRYPEERYVNYFQSLADGYMAEHPNVQINVEVVGDVAMKDKLKVMVGGGEIPDIFYSWPGEFAGQFARNGKVLDLTPYIEADTEWKDSISSVFWDYVDMYDMHVGVPFRFSLSVMEYGPFEMTDKDVPFMLFMNDGNTRPMDTRALAFLKRMGAKVTVVDAKDYGLANVIPAKVKDYFNPILIDGILRVYAEAIAEARKHPLTQRRYMWKLEY